MRFRDCRIIRSKGISYTAITFPLAIRQAPTTPAFSPNLDTLSWVSLFTRLSENLLMALFAGISPSSQLPLFFW